MEGTVHGGQTDLLKRMALTKQSGIMTVFRMGMMSPGQLLTQGEGQKKERQRGREGRGDSKLVFCWTSSLTTVSSVYSACSI